MAELVARIEAWGHAVGAVAELRSGQVVFEYEPSFVRLGLELSPLHLPLARRGPISFPELARVESFAGLPGVLADALPDAFGNAVIRRYFESKGTPDAALSPLQRLLFIGRRAMGALEFTPPLALPLSDEGHEALEVARLVAEARRVIAGDPDVAIPEMMQSAATPGGARAKAVIRWNRATNVVRSAFAPAADGDEHWMIKFDGVTRGGGGHLSEAAFQPGPWGRIEFAYSRLARHAGLRMADCDLIREREFAHFVTKRFDRDGETRLHLHSLGGLLHLDYNQRGATSYEEYFRCIRLLGMGQPEVNEAFRRMVFNFAVRNQDDHVKNVAFLMDRTGRWQLAPAYDLVFAMDGPWARTHQMTANGKDDGFTRADLLAVGARFDVPRDGATIIDEVDAALAHWDREARAVELDAVLRTRIGAAFRRLGA